MIVNGTFKVTKILKKNKTRLFDKLKVGDTFTTRYFYCAGVIFEDSYATFSLKQLSNAVTSFELDVVEVASPVTEKRSLEGLKKFIAGKSYVGTGG